jgi:hypothetical protein
VSGSGVFVKDDAGRPYLDSVAGIGVWPAHRPVGINGCPRPWLLGPAIAVARAACAVGDLAKIPVALTPHWERPDPNLTSFGTVEGRLRAQFGGLRSVRAEMTLSRPI